MDDSQIVSKTGSWHWNVITNKVIWSKNMFRLLGLEPNELEPSYELAFHHVHEADKKQYEERLTNAVENKTSYYFENKITKKDRSVICVLSIGKCILDEDKKLVRMIGIVQDISIQKELEKIKEEKHKVEDREKMKSLILKVIAHDIKNPFNHINGFSGLLIENIQEKNFENVAAYGQIIKDATNSVLKVLDGLLNWAFTENDITLFNSESIALQKLVDDVIQFSKVFLTKKKLKLINKIPLDALINADKQMLTTIIRNLISNAIKYCNNSGEITIRLRQDDKEICLSISDTGVGITPGNLKNLFNSHKLLNTEGTNKEKGSGLGLQICKALVEKHNGKIWIESEVGKGTTCHFTLSRTQTINTDNKLTNLVLY